MLLLCGGRGFDVGVKQADWKICATTLVVSLKSRDAEKNNNFYKVFMDQEEKKYYNYMLECGNITTCWLYLAPQNSMSRWKT